MEHKDLQKLLSNQTYSFKPYFSDRVMAKLEEAKEDIDHSFSKALDFIFPRISMTSFAILCVVLMVAFINNGSMDINTLIGLNSYEESVLYPNFTKSF